jgi:uncharacterized oligopeptide transporter (OPT) family protein
MAIRHLTDEEVRTFSLQKKDDWWRQNVFRPDAPQLTVRAALTGIVLGAVLSLANLYIGIRVGWTLGVGVTAVIMSFASFKLLAALGVGRPMTLLENNAMQSIATAAGYMTAPLVSSLSAYMMITGRVIPAVHAAIWMMLLAALGVLFAFPLKKKLINDEQLRFPEGYATGVVLDGLHDGRGSEGLFKAKVLAAGAALSAVVELLRSARVMAALRLRALALPEAWDDLVYRFATPRLFGIPLRDLSIRLDTSIVLVGTGGLIGIRTAASLFAGGVVNYAILAPLLLRRGIIAQPTFAAINDWSIWSGAAMMTAASFAAFLASPGSIVQSFAGLRRRASEPRRDVLADIELPLRVSAWGIPLVGAAMVVAGHLFFDVPVLLGVLAVPLVFALTLIAVRATALTSMTPGGVVGAITQLASGAVARGDVATNLVAAGIASDVAVNASNLLTDIKPGYMLGARPRQQAVGHLLGAAAGTLVAVPVFYALFHGDVSRLASEHLPLPAAQLWRSVSQVLANGFGSLPRGAGLAMAVSAGLGIAMEIAAAATRRKLPLSGVAFGLGFVLRFSDTLAMTLGAFIFWMVARMALRPGSVARRTFVESQETLCAGVIAGGSIVGIALILAEALAPAGR